MRPVSSEPGQIDTAERQPAPAGGNRQPLESRFGKTRTAPSGGPPTSVDGHSDKRGLFPLRQDELVTGRWRFLRCSQQLRPLETPGAWLHGTASAPPWTEASLPRLRPHEVASLRFDSRVCPALESSTQPGSDLGPLRVRAPAVGLVHAGLGCLVFGPAPARLAIETRRPAFGPQVKARRLRAVILRAPHLRMGFPAGSGTCRQGIKAFCPAHHA
jgi:hypothetical protein